MKHVKSVNATMRSPRAVAAAGILTALALTLPACGRTGGEEPHSTHPQATGTSANPQATGTSANPQAAGTSTASLGSGGGAFCTAARKFETDQAVIHQAERAPGQGSSSAVLKAAQDSESTLTSLYALAPASLKPDVQVTNSGWKPFFDTLIRADGDMTKVPASVEQNMQSTVRQPQFQHVDDYEVQTCHFQPSAH
jgi:hypothetical protein